MHSLRIVLVFALTLGGSVIAADWPQWRGPHGSGIADDKNLPDRWTSTENVSWKASLAGLGVSSPIVSGDRVFVTSQIGEVITRQGPRLVQRGGSRRGSRLSLRSRSRSIREAARRRCRVDEGAPQSDRLWVSASLVDRRRSRHGRRWSKTSLTLSLSKGER